MHHPETKSPKKNAATEIVDAATEAAKLALRIGSAASDAAEFALELSENFPLVYVVLRTLKIIRDKVDNLKSNKDGLKALHERCTCITACVIVKCRRGDPPSDVDLRPLVDRMEEVERVVARYFKRGKVSRFLRSSYDKYEIARLHDRMGDTTEAMGLAGIFVVERKVDDLRRLLVSMCGLFETRAILLSTLTIIIHGVFLSFFFRLSTTVVQQLRPNEGRLCHL